MVILILKFIFQVRQHFEQSSAGQVRELLRPTALGQARVDRTISPVGTK